MKDGYPAGCIRDDECFVVHDEIEPPLERELIKPGNELKVPGGVSGTSCGITSCEGTSDEFCGIVKTWLGAVEGTDPYSSTDAIEIDVFVLEFALVVGTTGH
jgi:hypothetical protein